MLLRSPEELARHRAGDHGLCDPERAGHGVCSECGKTVAVGRSSAPPGRRRCRDCQRANPKGTHSPRDPRVCEQCGQTYVPKPAHRPDQRFCSKSCTQTWRNIERGLTGQVQRPPDWERTRALAKSRARHLRHAETWDGITDDEILERDGWRCQIPGCKRRPIRRDLKYPHLRSKSIDHIIPLSLGGDDTSTNKRAAHLGCNMARGNQMGEEQVALFGSLREPPLVTRTASGATIRPPLPPRLCEICREPLVNGRCGLHSRVWLRSCGCCGRLFVARNPRHRFCREAMCEARRAAARRLAASEEAQERKRRRDRERQQRLRANPDSLGRIREIKRRSYARRKWQRAAQSNGQSELNFAS